MTKVGVIGLGMMGLTHLDAYKKRDDVTIAAISDKDPDRLSGKVQASGNVEAIYKDMKLTCDQAVIYMVVSLAMATALLALGLLGVIVNMTPRYVFSLTPLFFACIGAFCASFFHGPKDRNFILAVMPAVLLVCAGLPPLASYFLERKNISYTAAARYVIDHAAPNDISEGNVGSAFVDASALVSMKWVAAPTDESFDWSGYLRRYEANETTVWFVYDVPRSGLAHHSVRRQNFPGIPICWAAGRQC